MAESGPTRRERQRAATQAEIRETARKLLIASGPEAMSISAVARRIGLSGPAIYRYYASRDELVGAVIADLFAELAQAVERARDDLGDAEPGERLLVMSRAMRAWAIGHAAEFRLVFAVPIAEGNRQPDSERQRAGEAFDQVLLNEFEALWQSRPFAVPELDRLAPSLRRQVLDYAERRRTPLPPAAVHVFLTCWIRLYGLLVMEVLDQLAFAFSDPEPIFEACLRDISELIGIEYFAPEMTDGG